MGKRYFCLQQSPLALAWSLYTSGSTRMGSALGLEPGAARGAVRALLRQKLLPRRPLDSRLSLPVYGELCLPVHGGLKVFDLGRRRVTKFFAPEADEALLGREMDAVQTAAELSFAPDVYRTDRAHRCYQEEYVGGGRADLVVPAGGTKALYRSRIEPCIVELIRLRDPVPVDVEAYIDGGLAAMSRRISSVVGSGAGDLKAVERYMGSIAEAILAEHRGQLDLIYSHGDFSLRNMLIAGERLMVIDWESAGFRSVLCDLYNFFLTEAYYERLSRAEAEAGIDEAIRSLASTGAISAEVVESAALLRKVYFFERMLVLLERSLDAHRVRVISRSMKLFEAFESPSV